MLGTATPVRLGIDRLLAEPDRYLRGARRVALLANAASLTGGLRPTLAALRASRSVEVVALLTPEHGWSGLEDDATPVADAHDPAAGMPAHSLYGPRRRPDPDVLRSVDAVVVDVQDVGIRAYTYATTLALLLEAAADTGTRVVVCDRPNPLGGRVDGPALDPGLRSFLGYLDVPFQHGLTVGELARGHARRVGGAVDLVVVPVEGWTRDRWTPEPWVPPSPGLPTAAAALLYPGLVLLEGCTLSEGRGTSLPFALLGAPWVRAHALADAATGLGLPGLAVRPVQFRPTTDTHAGRTCHGIHLLVTDPDALRPLGSTVRLLRWLREGASGLAWTDASERPWARDADAGRPWHEPAAGPLVDALTGSTEVRDVVDGRADFSDVAHGWRGVATRHVDAVADDLCYAPAPHADGPGPDRQRRR